MSFSHKYNYEDIHLRAITRGLVNLLNNKVFYKQYLKDDKKDIVQVPFYFQMTGDERFLQNNFMEWDDCQSDKFAEGNYEILPRGIVKFTDDSINSAALTTRFIRATYTKEVNGQIETYSANINPLPLIENFEINIVASTLTELSKIKDRILETFVFVQVYNVKFKGFMISCQVKFPDTLPMEKNFEYQYPDEDNDYKLIFSLEIETYYPVLDVPGVVKENFKYYLDPEQAEKFVIKDTTNELTPLASRNDETDPNNNLAVKGSTERHMNSKMESVLISNFDVNLDTEESVSITLLTPVHKQEAESGKNTSFTWKTKGYIHKVDLFYSTNNGSSWDVIEKFVKNDEKYVWTVPEINNEYAEIVFISDRGQNAKAKALVDIGGSVYSSIIEDPGVGYDETLVATIESQDGSGCTLQPVIVNGKIVDIIILNGGSGYIPNKITNLNILIRSSANANTFDILKDENDELGYIILQ